MLAKRHLLTLCVGAVACFTPFYSSAEMQETECSEDIIMSYYPEPFVAETLEKFEIPQAQRSAIIRDLAEKDREVVPIVEEKAGKMSPNPLRDPKHRQEAIKIFRDTLYELFAATMQAHGVNDQEQIQAMLDNIQQQKAKQFAACMERFHSDRPERRSVFSKRENFSRQQRGPNSDYNNYEQNDQFNGQKSQTDYRQGY